MKMMLRQTLCVLALMSLSLVSPAPIRAWKLESAALQAVTRPGEFQAQPALLAADFDGDRVLERVVLSAEQVKLQTGGQTRWQSPDTWRVKQASLADLNRDGQPEVILLVWRPFKAWPVDQWLPSGGQINDFQAANGMSCHLILIGWQAGQFRERWAGSALAAPVTGFATADLVGDGKQFLVTLESEYSAPPSALARKLKVWEWNGFGFSLVSEQAGRFSQLVIGLNAAGRTIILTP